MSPHSDPRRPSLAPSVWIRKIEADLSDLLKIKR